MAWFASPPRDGEGNILPPQETQQRDQACKTAKTDPIKAVEIAREIADPWFACQAMTRAARHSSDDTFDKLVEEAFRVSQKSTDLFQVVAVSAWPIRAMIDRGRVGKIDSILYSLLELAKAIEPLSSRSEALFLLLQSVYPVGAQSRLLVVRAIAEASTPTVSWRQARNLRDTILMIWNDHPEVASDLLERVAGAKTRRQVLQKVERGEFYMPRNVW